MSVGTAIVISSFRPISFHRHCFSRSISSSPAASFRSSGKLGVPDTEVFNEYMAAGAVLDEEKTVNKATPGPPLHS